MKFSTLSFIALSVATVAADYRGCIGNTLQNICFQLPCNPEWFNWLKGCTYEVTDRTAKPVDITNALDTVFHILPDSQLYTLDYIDTISTKTQKISEKIYKWDFLDHTGATPLFKDALKAVEDVIDKAGMNNPVYDNIGWIKQNIQKYDSSPKIENALGKIQAYLKSAFSTLDETLKLTKSFYLRDSQFLQNSISQTEQILANLFVVDNSLEAALKTWQNEDELLMKHGYFTYQLLFHCAILHVNIKSLIAIASYDQDVQIEQAKSSLQVLTQYQGAFYQYTYKAINWRKSFVSEVQCQQGPDSTCPQTKCLRTTYFWTDDMRNVRVDESNWIMTQENQFYNLCFHYGEITDGIAMRIERDNYVKKLESKMQEVYQQYYDNIQKISKGIFYPKDETPSTNSTQSANLSPF